MKNVAALLLDPERKLIHKPKLTKRQKHIYNRKQKYLQNLN